MQPFHPGESSYTRGARLNIAAGVDIPGMGTRDLSGIAVYLGIRGII